MGYNRAHVAKSSGGGVATDLVNLDSNRVRELILLSQIWITFVRPHSTFNFNKINVRALILLVALLHLQLSIIATSLMR
jgi:hypothetical protein